MPTHVYSPTDDAARLEHQKKKDDFMVRAFKRWRTVDDAEKTLRNKQLDDLRWRLGGDFQWDERARAERQVQSRPWITVNRFPEAIHQVVNDERMLGGSPQVHPVDDSADQDTAEVLQGIIRHIEHRSDAPSIYANAAMWQTTIGRGYFRVVTEPAHERDFGLEIRLKQVRNPFQVYVDPTASEPDQRDIRYAFIVNDMPKDEYVSRYGQERADEVRASLTRFQSMGDAANGWEPEGAIRVAEYFYVDEEDDELLLLAPVDEQTAELAQMWPQLNEPIYKSELPSEWEGRIPEGFQVVESRRTQRRQVRWALIDGAGIIVGNHGRDAERNTEGRPVDGKYIPIVSVVGDEIVNGEDGEVDYRGVVRDGKDPQRVYNFQVTSMIEMINTSKTAPWIGFKGQFKGYEKKWNNANVRNYPYLEVNPVTHGGQLLPPPQRNVQEPPIVAIVQSIQQADNDLKATMRWHDASLGEPGPAESGRAIERRQRQDQTSNGHYAAHMNRAKKFLADILIDLIPKVYDTPRVMRIMGQDDKQTAVMIHGGNTPEGFNPETEKEQLNVSGIYDLSAGVYDTTVSIGPSYQTLRQEVVDHLTTIFQHQPQMFPSYADLYFESLDSPVAKRLHRRAERMLPPQFQDDEGQEDWPAAAMQQVDQLTQQVEQLTQQNQMMQQQIMTDQTRMEGQLKIAQAKGEMDLAKSSQELQGKMALAGEELQAKMAMEKQKAQADVGIAGAKLSAEQQMAQFNAQIEAMKLTLKQQGELSMQTLKKELETHNAQLQAELEMVKSELKQQEQLVKTAAETAAQMAINKHASTLLPRSETDETRTVI